MFCFRCGKKLPPMVVNCPECDTPQKRRKRYRTRMILGLFIFLAGAIAGSLFDSLLFKGSVWEHSFFSNLEFRKNSELNNSNETDLTVKNDFAGSETVGLNPQPDQKIQETDFVKIDQMTKASETISTNEGSVSEITESANQQMNEFAENASASFEAPPEELQDEKPEVVKPARMVFDKVIDVVTGDFNCYHAFVAKDLSEIVFASDKANVDGKKYYQCYIKKWNEKGSGERVFEWPGQVWTPELTPDNKLIIFSSNSRTPEHIFAYDRQTKKAVALTMGKSKNMMPALSPDGSLIAYVSNEKGTNDIWIMGIDGSNKIQITQTPEDDREPRWLPDGRGLVFTRIFENLKKSYIMKVILDPKSDEEVLISDGGRNWLADVSPDGGTIAFVRSLAGDGSKNTIFIMNFEDKQPVELKLLGNAECFRPIWLSDSSGFVFHANVKKSKNIYEAVFKRE
ncbi:MAG: hypothetical protein Kow0029_16440 [Candidatus Rifleibacteriota bacterium]